MKTSIPRRLPALALAALVPALVTAQQHAPSMHAMHHGATSAEVPPPPDTRVLVAYPDAMRQHTLASMRDHLAALQEIQAHLGRGELEAAGRVAESRLGMSSLPLHGAEQAAPLMPEGMRAAGTAMHRAASRFVLTAQEATLDNDLRKPLAALADITAACVTCHAGYRLQ